MLCEEHIEKQKEIDLGLVVPLANEEKVPLRLEGSRCWHSHTAQPHSPAGAGLLVDPTGHLYGTQPAHLCRIQPCNQD